MAYLTHCPITFPNSSASDLVRSSSNGVSGLPLKVLGRSKMGAKRVDFTVSANMRKVKKHEYPWSDDPDPNVKGGVLSHLSPFKPLKEKPKLVTLDFEKPLMDLRKKIIDIRKLADETGLDFSDQIALLENKYQQALKDLYTHLTPIQRVNTARHPNRPTFLDHVLNITDKFVELHGDRAGYDDPAIVTGIGSINGRSYIFIGHQKGRNTKENIQRNFGMPTPHGYRKALRMMYYADHHGFPIVTFIDTPGAFADLKSEELGQGEAIAHNLRTMFGLKVPIVSVVIGEGGSGGALAIGCANKLLMLENAVFYVARKCFYNFGTLRPVSVCLDRNKFVFIETCEFRYSTCVSLRFIEKRKCFGRFDGKETKFCSLEACAAILWKSAKASPKAAEKLRITATELCKLQVADGVIPEPLGGAHANPTWTSQQIKIAVVEAMDELIKMDTQELLRHRMLKFRKLGGFQEGFPVDPEKKVNMKKKEEHVTIGKISDPELEDEIEKLKQKILKAKESSAQPPVLDLDEMIGKLRREVDQEFSEAVKSMGLKDRLEMLREEFANAKNSPNPLMHPDLKDKIEKLKEEFNQGLAETPNYNSLSYKLGMLKEISEAKKSSEKYDKETTLKQEINKRFNEVLTWSDLKEKIDNLKADTNAGISTDGGLDHGHKEKIMKVTKEIKSELVDVLKSLSLDVKVLEPKAKDFGEHTSFSDLNVKLKELNEEIYQGIEIAVNFPDLKDKIKLLKLEVAKAGKNPDIESKIKIEALEQQIKQNLAEAVNSPTLIEKYEQLRVETVKARQPFGGSDGSLNQEAPKRESFKYDGSITEINVGANHSFA